VFPQLFSCKYKIKQILSRLLSQIYACDNDTYHNHKPQFGFLCLTHHYCDCKDCANAKMLFIIYSARSENFSHAPTQGFPKRLLALTSTPLSAWPISANSCATPAQSSARNASAKAWLLASHQAHSWRKRSAFSQ